VDLRHQLRVKDINFCDLWYRLSFSGSLAFRCFKSRNMYKTLWSEWYSL